ncbi:MAG: ABC transporter ATP-binding protein/permease [bacterium]|nr:ABC transporter ATP-binding protein/permease [bacterium]
MKLSETEAKNSYRYMWLMKRIFPYLKPVIGRLILGVLIAIPLGLLDGVTAFALKPYLDYVVGQKDLHFSLFGNSYTLTSAMFAMIIPFGVVIFAAVQGLLRYLNTYMSEWTSKKITNGIMVDLYRNLINQDTSFFDENSSGIIQSRYLNDPQQTSERLVDNLRNIITSFFGALGLIAVMLYSSWLLALVGVSVLCVAFLPVAMIRKVIKKTSNQDMVISGNIRTYINEAYLGNKIITSYRLQNRQNKLYEKEIHDSFNVAMTLVKRSGWTSPIMYLIASFGIAFVLWFGTNLITTGALTAGGFASFVTSLLLLYKPVKTLGGTITSIQKVFVAFCRIFELFDCEPEIKSADNAVAFNHLEHGITLQNVSFEYIKDTPVLTNINLEINKNETLAIVGNSGGGKSTLINLIARLYDVTSGAIKFDDMNIKDISLEDLRDNIAVVFQDNFLFSGTIRDNILMGSQTATEEDVHNALKLAFLDDTVNEMKDGLDTIIGENGIALSGGQRQRVAIARAILKNAPIIILDEATSALDNQSEAIVQKAIDNLMKEKTVFVIAHRLSTIKNADRIAVINEGELVELGTHDELLKIQGGVYSSLYEMQFKKQTAEAVL